MLLIDLDTFFFGNEQCWMSANGGLEKTYRYKTENGLKPSSLRKDLFFYVFG